VLENCRVLINQIIAGVSGGAPAIPCGFRAARCTDSKPHMPGAQWLHAGGLRASDHRPRQAGRAARVAAANGPAGSDYDRQGLQQLLVRGGPGRLGPVPAGNTMSARLRRRRPPLVVRRGRRCSPALSQRFSALNGIAAACTTSSRSRAHATSSSRGTASSIVYLRLQNRLTASWCASKPRHRFAKCSYEQCDCNTCDCRPNDVGESLSQDVQHCSNSPERPEYFPSQRDEIPGEIGAPQPTLNLG
jgi:hypothetical protein